MRARASIVRPRVVEMIGELLLRFLLGGLVVSAFSLAGEVFKPKTFAGLFGAAPSVSMATLGLTCVQHGDRYAATEGRSMILGAAGFLVYALACAWGAKKPRLPVYAGAAGFWGLWLGVTFGLATVLQLWGKT